MRSADPALGEKTFEQFGNWGAAEASSAMTVQGTAMKTGILLALAVASASFTWSQFGANPQAAWGWTIGGAIAGFIVAMITTFKAAWSPVTAPIYALVEGLFLGGISAAIQSYFPE